jgi:hypothetical protein
MAAPAPEGIADATAAANRELGICAATSWASVASSTSRSEVVRATW